MYRITRTMESLNAVSVVGIFCLLWISLVSGEKDYNRSRPKVHEMRDAIHQVEYNYPSWPSPESSYKAPVQSSQTTTTPMPPPNDGGVTTLDRFYRVDPDGTVEFKVALSDGQINYQKIYNKVLNGRTIQVYDGYYGVRLADGRYRTTYYRADEKGYRLMGYNVDRMPPTDRREHLRDKMH